MSVIICDLGFVSESVCACAVKLYTVFETKQVIKFADQRPGIKVNLLTRNVKYQIEHHGCMICVSCGDHWSCSGNKRNGSSS